MVVNPAQASPSDCAGVRAAVLARHERLRGLLSGLDEDAVRAPSVLPGWSRAHVLAHIAGVCRALARQTAYALRGELVEVYDGGRPARDAGIEAGAVRGADELRRDVADALAEAEAVWASVTEDDWTRRVAYRDGDVRTVLFAWWRESEIHTADLGLPGAGPQDWPRDLAAHLLDFLAPRTPEGVELRLEAADGPERRINGSGAAVTVRGDLRALAAWMAGRLLPSPVVSDPAPLPELGPWPS